MAAPLHWFGGAYVFNLVFYLCCRANTWLETLYHSEDAPLSRDMYSDRRESNNTLASSRFGSSFYTCTPRTSHTHRKQSRFFTSQSYHRLNVMIFSPYLLLVRRLLIWDRMESHCGYLCRGSLFEPAFVLCVCVVRMCVCARAYIFDRSCEICLA